MSHSQVSDGFYNKTLQLRSEYSSCVKLAIETDSKKEEALLKKEAADVLEKLRKVCPHQHTVCLCTEYDGSYSFDDVPCKEHRICLYCGVEEYAWNPNWKILTTVPFSRFASNPPAQIKNPLSHLLTDVLEIAMEKGFKYFIYKGK